MGSGLQFKIIDFMFMSTVVVNVVVVILNISMINLMLHDQACNSGSMNSCHVFAQDFLGSLLCANFEVSLPLLAMPFQKKKADKKYVNAVPVFKTLHESEAPVIC